MWRRTALKDLKYDLAIIGGGAAGLVSAVAAGAFGARVALIEKTDRLGGECSWTGCIPSKALISYAEGVYRFNNTFGKSKNFKRIGLKDNKDVFKHIKQITETASKASKTKELLDRYDVKVFFGDASFKDNHNIKIGSKNIFARKIILCTGSSPVIPDIEGMEGGYLTNRDIWDLPEPPESMLIVGAGNIGLEMAQALGRLGTKIHLFESKDSILPKDDRELALELLEIFIKENIDIHLNTRINWVKFRAGKCTICIGDENKEFSAEKMLIAVGRKPNTEGLDLETVGVEYSKSGIIVNKSLRTTAKNIWAAGDCNGINQFSHIAEVEARIAVRNSLFPFSSKVDYQGIPWTTFTDPELSHLGLTEDQCKDMGLKYNVYRQPFSGDERAIVEEKQEGRVKILATRTGKILGAHILGNHSGELINEFVLARKKSARIYDIGLTSHVYPTMGMALQRATDEWFAEIIRPSWIRKILKLLMLR
jgi:pyruvate/2-oxoglutarate dehydrogenase complex dihydrolipoamide dehydrogenase (E3) component